MTRTLRGLRRASGMNAVNAEYIDQLYEAFKASPDNVSAEWRHYFYGFEHGADGQAPSLAGPLHDPHSGAERLIMAYRMLGHLCAHTDPLQLHDPQKPVELDPGYYGLDDAALALRVCHVSIDPAAELPLGGDFAT